MKTSRSEPILAKQGVDRSFHPAQGISTVPMKSDLTARVLGI